MNHFQLIRLSAVMTFVIPLIAFAQTPDIEAAIADRAAHYSPEDYKYISYLTTRPWTGQQRTDLERAIKLAVASDSIQPVLERCVPVHVNETLLRIDIRDLKWRYEDWYEVAYKRNPYALKGDLPLVVRADWLLSELSDMRDSNTYQLLIFGGDNLPKTKDDVFKFFGIGTNKNQTFGYIEGQSGVSVQGTRLIESLPIARTEAFITSDVKKLDGRRDPLENLFGFKPDGQEGIVGIFKESITTGQQCSLNWYWLNNGDGKLVNEAPGDLVSANPPFRHSSIIATPGACIQCHQQGWQTLTKNELRVYFKSNAQIFQSIKDRDEIERKLLTNLDEELRRATDQFTLAAVLMSGCAAVDASKSYRAAIESYDGRLNLEQTAAELNVSPIEWTQALALNGVLAAGRLASLPHGGTIPREAWEEQWPDAYYATHGGRPLPQEKPKAVEPVKAKPQVKSGRRY